MPEETTRRPAIGEPIVFRGCLDSDLCPGIIQMLYKEEDDSISFEVMVVVFPYGDGIDNFKAKYHQGASYAMSWCWPGEAVME